MKTENGIVYFTTDHFNAKHYLDLALIPFEKHHEISMIYLTSKTVDLNACDFRFKPNFSNWKERNFLSSNPLWPVFSKRLVELIKKHDPRFVHFPATIVGKRGAEVRGEFFVAQVPRMNGMVDLDASVVQRDPMFPEIFQTITKLVFKSGTTPPPLFRLSEYAQVILATPALSEDLANANLDGLTLTDAGKYDWALM